MVHQIFYVRNMQISSDPDNVPFNASKRSELHRKISWRSFNEAHGVNKIASLMIISKNQRVISVIKNLIQIKFSVRLSEAILETINILISLNDKICRLLIAGVKFLKFLIDVRCLQPESRGLGEGAAANFKSPRQVVQASLMRRIAKKESFLPLGR